MPQARVQGVEQRSEGTRGDCRVRVDQQPQARAPVRGARGARHPQPQLQAPEQRCRRRHHGHCRSLATNSLGLSGKGETIAVCDTGLDTGDPAGIHPDFAGRVAWIKSYPITPDFNSYIKNPGGNDGPADLDSGHGTHVAGSVLGNGTASQDLAGTSGPIRGTAHAARLVFQAVEQELQWKNPADAQDYGRYLLAGIPADLGTLFADAYRKGVRIHSNSWGGGDPGEYDEQSEQLDRFVLEAAHLLRAGCGRQRRHRCRRRRRDQPHERDLAGDRQELHHGRRLREPACPAFNSETYGKWWLGDYPVAPFRNDPMADDSAQVVAFSGRGPTRDGRSKPEVVAPGTFILSTRSTQIAANNQAWAAFPPSKLYFHMGGTSMATPLAAGAVGLIREYLRRHQRVGSPSAALLKATLILGAQRLPGYAAAEDRARQPAGFRACRRRRSAGAGRAGDHRVPRCQTGAAHRRSAALPAAGEVQPGPGCGSCWRTATTRGRRWSTI
ncbi:MAG: S8 family serine peptidase [Comamonadaceae bacterium]|nr:S8 family serine peptidase [Comamonadaceae bacterium]